MQKNRQMFTFVPEEIRDANRTDRSRRYHRTYSSSATHTSDIRLRCRTRVRMLASRLAIAFEIKPLVTPNDAAALLKR